MSENTTSENNQDPQNQFTKLSDKKEFSSKEQQEVIKQLKADSGKIFSDLYSADSKELYSMIDDMSKNYGPALSQTFFTQFVAVLKSFVGLKENKSSKQELYNSYDLFQKEFEEYQESLSDSISFLQNQSKEKAKLVQKYSFLIDTTYKDVQDLQSEIKKYEKNIEFINTNYESLCHQQDIDPDYSLELYTQQLFSVQDELAFKENDYQIKRQEKINMTQEIAQSTLQKKIFMQTKQSIDMLSKKVELKLEELLREDPSVIFSKSEAAKTKFAQTQVKEQNLEEKLTQKHNEFVQSKPKLSDMYKQLYKQRTQQRKRYH
ncbi:MAG: hypothetical protein ACOCQQ_02215 [Candidatus Nanoarchaeia archaeon]